MLYEMETKMKILRNVFVSVILFSALIGFACAAGNQDEDKVGTLSQKYGYDGAKRLLLNRMRVETVLDEKFNPSKGTKEAKNAKKFIRDVFLEVEGKFKDHGRPEREIFLDALDDVTKAGDLTVNIASVNFKHASAPTPQMVSSAADLVFAGLGLDDPTLELLSRASDLKIKARTADGKTVESLLTDYEAVKDRPAEAGKFLRGVDAMKFGKSQKTLAEKVDARVTKHQTAGKYATVGVDEDDDNAIGAFHEAIRSAREEGARDSDAAKKARIALDFAAQIKSLFEDGILETGEPIDFSTPAGYSKALQILKEQGSKVTELQALLARKGRK
jgi:hypothetical protein